MPSLEKLLGDSLQGLEVGCGLYGPVHALEFKLLAEAEGEWFRHGTHHK